VIPLSTTSRAAAAPCAAIFPLQPNQIPDLSLSAALTATASPPARALVLFSGIATRFETTISCPNGDPRVDRMDELHINHARWSIVAQSQQIVRFHRLDCSSRRGGLSIRDFRRKYWTLSALISRKAISWTSS